MPQSRRRRFRNRAALFRREKQTKFMLTLRPRLRLLCISKLSRVSSDRETNPDFAFDRVTKIQEIYLFKSTYYIISILRLLSRIKVCFIFPTRNVLCFLISFKRQSSRHYLTIAAYLTDVIIRTLAEKKQLTTCKN